MPASSAQFDARALFIIELARRLHVAGVTASRLEGAIKATADSLGVTCEIWSAPTGLLISLGARGELQGPQLTRVLRLEPANVDLSALATLDVIADRVIAGELDAREGMREMAALDRPREKREIVSEVIAFALSGAGVAGLLRTGWTDIAVAAALGLLIGWFAIKGRARAHVAHAMEALAAFVATFLAIAFATLVSPIAVQTVAIAALIVLMPGLTLTTAVTELASQQLVTGTTRFAGAVITLLKLTFGSIAATTVTRVFGWVPDSPRETPLPAVVELIALAAASYSLALLFRTDKRDMWLVVGSAAFGYLLTRAGSTVLGLGDSTGFAAPVFFSSMIMAALANLYGRIAKRPAALVRVPGIMLLVPGSIGFRSMSSVIERDYALGVDAGLAVLSALVALMAGLLSGSLLVTPRRYL